VLRKFRGLPIRAGYRSCRRRRTGCPVLPLKRGNGGSGSTGMRVTMSRSLYYRLSRHREHLEDLDERPGSSRAGARHRL